jgi:hypothetical protein
MLLERDVPEEKIRSLKVGAYLIDGVITRTWRYQNIITFITSAGRRYNAHKKEKGYNLFRIDDYRPKTEAKNLKPPER